MNKEQVYDKKIEPLLCHIEMICIEHGIAMLATFDIGIDGDGDNVNATAVLPDESGNVPDDIATAYKSFGFPMPIEELVKEMMG